MDACRLVDAVSKQPHITIGYYDVVHDSACCGCTKPFEYMYMLARLSCRDTSKECIVTLRPYLDRKLPLVSATIDSHICPCKRKIPIFTMSYDVAETLGIRHMASLTDLELQLHVLSCENPVAIKAMTCAATATEKRSFNISEPFLYSNDEFLAGPNIFGAFESPTGATSSLAAILNNVVVSRSQRVGTAAYGPLQSTSITISSVDEDAPVVRLCSTTQYVPPHTHNRVPAPTSVLNSEFMDRWLSNALHANIVHLEELRRVIRLSCSGTHGFFVSGNVGSGKTTFLSSLNSSVPSGNIYTIPASQLFQGSAGGTEGVLQALLHHAMGAANVGTPSLILIENLEELLPKNPKSMLVKRLARILLQSMEKVVERSLPVIFVGTCVSQLALDSSAVDDCLFAAEIHLPAPVPVQRLHFFKHHPTVGESLDDDALNTLVRHTHGYSMADLASVIREGVYLRLKQMDGPLGDNLSVSSALQQAACKGKASLLRDAIGSRPIPTITLQDLELVSSNARAAKLALSSSISSRSVFQEFGITPPAGMLISGPPGSGKSTLALALAAYAEDEGVANALVIHGPDIVSAYVGATETALHAAFSRARELSPCILVFDQFDVLAPPRTFQSDDIASSQRLDRLLSVLLTEMDGIGVGSGSSVYVVAVARDLSQLDPAVTRPGRLDVRISLTLPDSEERRATLAYFFAKSGLPASVRVDVGVAAWQNLLNELVVATDNWTPAELQGLWEDAAFFALRHTIDFEAEAGICEDDIRASLRKSTRLRVASG